MKLFEQQDKIKSFEDIDSTLTPPGYTFQKYDDHVVFYHFEINVLNVPKVTDCVRVNQDLHVKLFYKSSPLPQRFRHGRDCRLTRKSMMQNFPNYIKLEESRRSVFWKSSKSSNSRKKEYSRPMLFDIHFFYVMLP